MGERVLGWGIVKWGREEKAHHISTIHSRDYQHVFKKVLKYLHLKSFFSSNCVAADTKIFFAIFSLLLFLIIFANIINYKFGGWFACAERLLASHSLTVSHLSVPQDQLTLVSCKKQCFMCKGRGRQIMRETGETNLELSDTFLLKDRLQLQFLKSSSSSYSFFRWKLERH